MCRDVSSSPCLSTRCWIWTLTIGESDDGPGVQMCSPTSGEATMGKTIGLLLAVTALAIGTASAQSLLRPGTPHMFRWTPEQQAEWYPAIETVYRSATVKRGDYVHPLPKAD